MIKLRTKLAIYGAIFVAILGWFYFAFVAQSYISDLWLEKETEGKRQLTNNVQLQIDNMFDGLQTLVIFVNSLENIEEDIDHIDLFAEGFLEKDQIYNFSIAPLGIQTYVYPPTQDVILNHDLLNDEREDVRDAVYAAITTGKPQINGPYEMRTEPGNSIIVFRYPLFSEGDFTSLVNIVVKSETVLGSIEDETSAIYNFQIVDSNNRLILGENHVNAIVAEELVETGEFDWKITFSYKDSYILSKELFIYKLDAVFFASLALIIGITIVLIFLLRNLVREIRNMVYNDQLTNIPSRKFIDEIENKMYKQYTCLFIDIDDFKYINDTYGHKVGDELLVSLTGVFKEAFEGEIILRWGGDEFIVFIKEVDEEVISNTLMELLSTFDDTFKLNDIEIKISLSIGAYISSSPNSIEDSIKYADIAMYDVKLSGKAGFSFYDFKKEYYLKQMIRFDQKSKTIDLDESADIHFQPKFSFEDDCLIGMEALLRLTDAETPYLPSGFIEAAENNGTILSIDRFAIKKVLKYQKVFKKNGIEVPIAINLSGVSLRSGILNYITKLVSKNLMKPSSIEIEVTESISLGTIDDYYTIFKKLKEMGFRILMDDFGKQFSGLDTFSKLPIDTIKIDREFVWNLQSVKTRKIVESITSLSREMDIDCIAEGIETMEQYEYLKSVGCKGFQGYLYERVISFIEMVNKYKK